MDYRRYMQQALTLASLAVGCAEQGCGHLRQRHGSQRGFSGSRGNFGAAKSAASAQTPLAGGRNPFCHNGTLPHVRRSHCALPSWPGGLRLPRQPLGSLRLRF